MDILTQYYNEAGQIISRTPDLTSREFYRDAMCRHRFNEMFVPINKIDPFLYYYKSDKKIELNGYCVANALKLPAQYSANVGFFSKTGFNGRQAIGCQEGMSLYFPFLPSGFYVSGAQAGWSLGAIVKSGSQSDSDNGYSLNIMCDLNDKNLHRMGFSIEGKDGSTGNRHISISCPWLNENQIDGPSYLTNSSWHEFVLSFSASNVLFKFSVDGSVVSSSTVDSGVDPSLYDFSNNSSIAVALVADSNKNWPILIDSLWFEVQ